MRKFLKNVAIFGLCILPIAVLPFAAIFFFVDVEACDSMMGELNYKIERLASMPSPKIVFIGGSGCSHGIDSEMVENAFGVPVVNMGLHAGMKLRYQLSSIDPYIHKGDYVIIIPEYSNFINCLGGKELLMVVSDIRPSDRSKLDWHQWLNLIQYMPEYGQHKINRIAKNIVKYAFRDHIKKTDHDYGFYAYDERGDMISSRHDTQNRDFKPYGASNSAELLDADQNDSIQRINQFISLHTETTVAILPAAIQDASFDNDASYISAVAKILDRNGTPFMAKPERYRMLTTECWDTPYHLNAIGIERRTRLLIDDLKPIIR